MDTHKFLRRKAASQYLEDTWGVTRAPSTLAKYAVIGGGPTFRRAGRVPLYSTDDLDEWVVSKLSAPMRSTSEEVVAGAVDAMTRAAAGGRKTPQEHGGHGRA